MTIDVMKRVSQPPTGNFSMVVMTRTVAQTVKPVKWTGRCFFQWGSVLRFLMKNRDMPVSERVKVKKTLIEYMTTRVEILPCE